MYQTKFTSSSSFILEKGASGMGAGMSAISGDPMFDLSIGGTGLVSDSLSIFFEYNCVTFSSWLSTESMFLVLRNLAALIPVYDVWNLFLAKHDDSILIWCDLIWWY